MVGAKNIACTFAGVRSVYFTIIPPLARFGRYIRPNRLMGQEYALLLFRDFQSPSLAWALPLPSRARTFNAFTMSDLLRIVTR